MIELDRSNHPCFNREASHRYARIHLPVAPKCNIQCNFCNRKYDCVNEGRPGVTSAVLSPKQALSYLDKALTREPRIRVIGIAGPGDPFANPDETLETLRLIRAKHPDLLLCIASNGLGIAEHVMELAALGLSHATITINAVDPEIGSRIYAWARDGKVIHRGKEAARMLLERQEQAVRDLKASGITVKINAIVIPGVNDGHIVSIAEKAASWGADLLNCIPLLPTADTPFADVSEPDAERMAAIRDQARKYLSQMEHCTRCRADAAGLLGCPTSSLLMNLLSESARGPLDPGEDRPCVAVASMEGILVNQHMGGAEELLIYRSGPNGFEYQERRRTPPPGAGQARWNALSDLLRDCRAVLVSQAGDSPKEVLKRRGIVVVETEGLIEMALAQISSGKNPESLQKRFQAGCGGCRGSGLGCG